MFKPFCQSGTFKTPEDAITCPRLTFGKKNEFCIGGQNLFLKRRGLRIEGSESLLQITHLREDDYARHQHADQTLPKPLVVLPHLQNLLMLSVPTFQKQPDPIQ